MDNHVDLTEVSEYFFNEAVDLKYRPDLILSIIGDTKYLKIDEDVKTAFKKLIRTSRELDTWVITGGINESVDQLVGEATDEDLNTNFLPLFGITNLNHLSLKDELMNNSSNEVLPKFRSYLLIFKIRIF